jgi:twitching motility protein PilT
LIREKKTFQLTSVIQTGRREGMQSMEEAVKLLLKQGTISPEDAAPHLPLAMPGSTDAPGLKAA